MTVVPEKVYFDRAIPARHYVYTGAELYNLKQTFKKGEAPVLCFGSSAVRRTTIKWHYSENVLKRFMRRYKILMFKYEHNTKLTNYIYSKPRKHWHNFDGALKNISAGHANSNEIEIWIYGKLLYVSLERYEMIMWLHTEEKKLRKLP